MNSKSSLGENALFLPTGTVESMTLITEWFSLHIESVVVLALVSRGGLKNAARWFRRSSTI
ncbi:MAG: hypothetical protein EB023_10275 [Flavobacteriia bacterium]|nr:hypothetical protein [Flavobacteriia bacterium]